MKLRVEKGQFRLLALFPIALVAFGFVFGHAFDSENEDFFDGMLQRFRIMHGNPDATIEDMQEFHESVESEGFEGMRGMHKRMHGEDLSIEEMLEFHNQRHGTELTLEDFKDFHEEDGSFGCPMMRNFS